MADLNIHHHAIHDFPLRWAKVHSSMKITYVQHFNAVTTYRFSISYENIYPQIFYKVHIQHVFTNYEKINILKYVVFSITLARPNPILPS
jgi:hypothetical protein